MTKSPPRAVSRGPSRPSAIDAALRRLATAGPCLPDGDQAIWRDLVGRGLAVELPAAGRFAITRAGIARLRRLAARAAGTPPWLAQHVPVRVSTRADRGSVEEGVAIDDGESPLAWLRNRKDKEGRPLIDAAAFAAGERLRVDITRAGLLARVTADWTALGGAGRGRRGSPADVLDGTIAARQRIERAFAAVGGDFAGLLVDVCGYLKGLETLEAERGWPARSAKVVLTIALRRLAEHYGYASAARGPDKSAGIRAWTSDPIAGKG